MPQQGVYDVHSPVVPEVAALAEKLRSFVATGILAGEPERLWVNPDCGLKTRAWAEASACLVGGEIGGGGRGWQHTPPPPKPDKTAGLAGADQSTWRRNSHQRVPLDNHPRPPAR